MAVRVNYARRGLKTVDEYVDIYGGKTESEDFSEETLTEAKIWCRSCRRLDKKVISTIEDRDLKNNPIICTQCLNKNIDVAYLTTDIIPRIYVDENHKNCHKEQYDEVRRMYDSGELPEPLHAAVQILFNGDYYGVGPNGNATYKNPDEPMPGNIVNPETGQIRTWRDYPWNEVTVLFPDAIDIADPEQVVPAFSNIDGFPKRLDFYTEIGGIKRDALGNTITDYLYSELAAANNIALWCIDNGAYSLYDSYAPPATKVGGTTFVYHTSSSSDNVQNAINADPSLLSIEQELTHTAQVVIRASQIWSWSGATPSDYPLSAAQRDAIEESYTEEPYPRAGLEVPSSEISIQTLTYQYEPGVVTVGNRGTYNVSNGGYQWTVSVSEATLIPDSAPITATINIGQIDLIIPPADAVDEPVFIGEGDCDCINTTTNVQLPGSPRYESEDYIRLTTGFELPPLPFLVNNTEDKTLCSTEQQAVIDKYPAIFPDYVTTSMRQAGTLFEGMSIGGLVPTQHNRIAPLPNCGPCIILNNSIYSSMLNIIIQVDLDSPIYDNSLFDLD